MKILVKLNPVTYGVDMFKKILLGAEDIPPLLQEVMGLNLDIFGYSLTAITDFLLVAIIGVILIYLATNRFKKAEA